MMFYESHLHDDSAEKKRSSSLALVPHAHQDHKAAHSKHEHKASRENQQDCASCQSSCKPGDVYCPCWKAQGIGRFSVQGRHRWCWKQGHDCNRCKRCGVPVRYGNLLLASPCMVRSCCGSLGLPDISRVRGNVDSECWTCSLHFSALLAFNVDASQSAMCAEGSGNLDNLHTLRWWCSASR